jgi:polysaccharide deacetylase 2 family uncharacterized protein YibQ
VKHITKQLALLKKYMLLHDDCIAIGHVGSPGKKTAEALKKAVPELQKNMQFITISQMLAYKDKKDFPF